MQFVYIKNKMGSTVLPLYNIVMKIYFIAFRNIIVKVRSSINKIADLLRSQSVTSPTEPKACLENKLSDCAQYFKFTKN